MYWTKSLGIGGAFLANDDFVVEEVPSKKMLVKFERKGGQVVPVSGPYFLYVLRKSGMTTKSAIEYIRKKTGLDEIGFAGLKDKNAVTSQYITTKKKIDDFDAGNISLSFVSPCKNFMQIGELESNKFRIVLHGCKNSRNVEKIIREIESRGMPNYFGPQRFGLHGNHHIGRLVLQGNYAEALDMINSTGREFTSLKQIGKKMLKFYVNAYQSHVFNLVLDDYISKNDKPFFGDLPITGFGTKLDPKSISAQIIRKDNLDTKNFFVRDLMMKCSGSHRKAFIDIKSIGFEIKNDSIVLDFELPPGSYATVLVREITKV